MEPVSVNSLDASSIKMGMRGLGGALRLGSKAIGHGSFEPNTCQQLQKA
jgi:hypothetical protein